MLRLPAGIGIDPRGSVYISDQGNQRLVRLWGGTAPSSPKRRAGRDWRRSAQRASRDRRRPRKRRRHRRGLRYSRVLVYGPEGPCSPEGGRGQRRRSRPWRVQPSGGRGARRPGRRHVADRELAAACVLAGRPARSCASGARAAPLRGRLRGPIGRRRPPVRRSARQRKQPRAGASTWPGFIARWGRRAWGQANSQPAALALDCAGGVYVADTNNNRVQRIFQLPPRPWRRLASRPGMASHRSTWRPS